MSRDWISLLIFFGICFAVGASGSAFTASWVRHSRDCRAIREIFTRGILADDTLRRLGALRFLPELRNLAPK